MKKFSDTVTKHVDAAAKIKNTNDVITPDHPAFNDMATSLKNMLGGDTVTHDPLTGIITVSKNGETLAEGKIHSASQADVDILRASGANVIDAPPLKKGRSKPKAATSTDDSSIDPAKVEAINNAKDFDELMAALQDIVSGGFFDPLTVTIDSAHADILSMAITTLLLDPNATVDDAVRFVSELSQDYDTLIKADNMELAYVTYQAAEILSSIATLRWSGKVWSVKLKEMSDAALKAGK